MLRDCGHPSIGQHLTDPVSGCSLVCFCFLFSYPSWKEVSGTELQQAATAFQESDASKSGSSVQGEEAVAASSGTSTPCRDPWERFGARYFKGTLKTKKSNDGGKERAVHIQVEV